MGHQSYVLLCTETTLSNPPVVQPKSSCDVHLLRSSWIKPPLVNHNKQKSQSCFSQQRGQSDSVHVFSCKSRHRAMKSKGLMQKIVLRMCEQKYNNEEGSISPLIDL